MKKRLLVLPLFLLSVLLFSQTGKVITIPMQPDSWEFQAGKVEFLKHLTVPAMKVLPQAGLVILKDLVFTTGTIEFDVEVLEPGFVSFAFRRQNDQELEWFYLRAFNMDNPLAVDAVQYAPNVKGVNLWDMLPHYQGPANIKKGGWNHIKLVISEHQMLAYVNSSKRSTLQIPFLEGNTTQGGLAFEGAATFANLVIKPEAAESLPNQPGFDPTDNDPQYLRKWSVTEPRVFPLGKDIVNEDVPTDSTMWKPIEAERRGLVNLTRKFGIGKTSKDV